MKRKFPSSDIKRSDPVQTHRMTHRHYKLHLPFHIQRKKSDLLKYNSIYLKVTENINLKIKIMHLKELNQHFCHFQLEVKCSYLRLHLSFSLECNSCNPSITKKHDHHANDNYQN